MAEKQYQFQRDVVHQGTNRTDGEIVNESDFPDGSLEPCLRTGIVVPYVAPKKSAKPPKDDPAADAAHTSDSHA